VTSYAPRSVSRPYLQTTKIHAEILLFLKRLYILIYSRVQLKEGDKMGGACGKQGGRGMCIHDSGAERDHLKDQGIDERIKLKCTLKK
jgi:hypothetical protein